MPVDRWADADAYERYMGRWSRSLARDFVRWLAVPPSAGWLEVGCGTGSLTTAICEDGAPASVVACDAADDFVAFCRERLRYPALTVVASPKDGLPAGASGFDAVVSSLVLNFLPDTNRALVQMRAACRPGGRVAACVWDYAEGMEFLRAFWDAAVAVDPGAAALHEGARLPLCRPDALRAAFVSAGLEAVEVAALTIPTPFASFEDFWAPFVDGPGPAPSYLASLSPESRRLLEERLHALLFPAEGKPARLRARAWAVRGYSPAASR